MTLEETMLSQELGNVNLSEITALQQKRTIAFVNHFVLTNVQFLNNFLKRCEQKLMHFERKLEKVNAAMVLLEAKLSSVPELDTSTSATLPPAPSDLVDAKPQENSSPQPIVEATEDNAPVKTEIVETKPDRPEYNRFIKMVQVGVPLQAVKLKVSLEGLDPNVLDEILNK